MNADARKIRAFIAVELPDSVEEFLEDVSSRLKKCGADVKWVKTNGIHLTLKLLGQVDTDLVPIIERNLRLLFGQQKPFFLHVSGLGAFPGLARPRVIWAGLNDPEGITPRLASKVEEILEPLGFQREKRPLTPHLTLGRVRSNKNCGDLIEAVRQGMDISGPTFEADHAVLFESVLKPTGAEYSVIGSFGFSGK
jgi:RNA 2',3'-cyclic 3'-phosphodiesterase